MIYFVKNSSFWKILPDKAVQVFVCAPFPTMVRGCKVKVYRIIKTELIPHIEKRYHVSTTERTLMGYSLGGYFTRYAMFRDMNDCPTFTNYVAASPSLWYNDNYLVQQFQQQPLQQGESSKSILFITTGEQELQYNGTDVNFNALL